VLLAVNVLGYSEDAALKRVRVARLAERLPRVLDELRSGAIHLTGLFLLSQHLTRENAEALLAEARHRSRRELERLIASWFPRPDVPERVVPAPGGCAPTSASFPFDAGPGQRVTCPEPGAPPPYGRLEPLSATRTRIEFTASA
jgi:hypothetical protein